MIENRQLTGHPNKIFQIVVLRQTEKSTITICKSVLNNNKNNCGKARR